MTAADREDEVSRKFALLAPVLDERQRRLWMAAEAREAGHGGITMVARATGAARSTVTRGVDELDSDATDSGRIRRAGAGRKRAETVNPELTAALERLVDPDTRGDPASPLRWTIKSTRQLSAALSGQGHQASEWLVRRLLHEAGYSLQAAAKQIEGTGHPDRDAADAGGSNGYRPRLWKTELAALAAETGLAITVCHFPPGTSKWNTIEHRLFSRISSNWRGETLTSHEVVVDLIAATTTRTGLTVRAELDPGEHHEGIKVSDKQIRELQARAITRHDWHGEWNYTLTNGAPDP